MLAAGLAWRRSHAVVLEARAAVVREHALRREAESGRTRAEAEAEKARGERYAAQVRLAFEALNHGLPEAGLEALGREDAASGGRSRRGWEWAFLSRWCGVAAGRGGAMREPGAGGARPGPVATLAFTNASAGIVAAGLMADGTRAWVATAAGMQAWDVTGARLLHEVGADAEAMESALWMGRGGTGGWVVRSWVGGRLGLRALDGEGGTKTVEEADWRPAPRYSGAMGMRFSQDGSKLVMADVANGVRVWEVPGLTLMRSFPGFPARTAEVSPAGDVVAASDGGGNVRIWGLTGTGTNAVAATLPGVQELGFWGEGRRLLAGTLDGWVRVLETGTGREVGACGPAGAAVLAVAMDIEGRRVAAGLSDGRVVIWDVGTGEVMGTLRPGMGAVQALRFVGRDGLALAAVGGVRLYPGSAESAPPR